MSTEGALSELLAHCPAYAANSSSVRPYVKDMMSWPSAGSVPVALDSLLLEADKVRLRDWKHHMLRSDEECAAARRRSHVARPFVDPTFKDARVYSDFLWHLHGAGMLRWTRALGRRSELGLFCVEKKGGKLRLIMDTRLVNLRFLPP